MVENLHYLNEGMTFNFRNDRLKTETGDTVFKEKFTDTDEVMTCKVHGRVSKLYLSLVAIGPKARLVTIIQIQKYHY